MIELRNSTRFKLYLVSYIGFGHVRRIKGSRVSENVRYIDTHRY